MRQETGKTNPPASHDEVSIRLWSDGHSFPELPVAIGPLRVVVLGRKCTLVPAEVFREEEAVRYLELCGLACSASECVVRSPERNGRVAVMAIERSVRERLPVGATFFSPLQDAEEPQQTVRMERYGHLLYIKVYAPTLRFAEAVRCDTDADVLYYVGRLAREFPLDRLTLSLKEGEEKGAGAGCAKLRKLLKAQFLRAVCE